MKVLLSTEEVRLYPDCPKEMPMDLFNEDWANRIHSQTLKRLNERGGLHPVEMIANIKKLSYSQMRTLDTALAIKALNDLLKSR